MADTIRQRLVDAIATRFAAILVAGGYKTNIGQNVTIWDTTPFEERSTGVDVRDMGGPIQQMLSTVHEQTLAFEAVVIANGSAAADDVREMVSDVIKAIGVDRQWSGLARNTLLKEDNMAMEHGEQLVAGVQIKFDVIYRFSGFDATTAA